MRIGTIYRHAAMYADPDTGELLPKFFVVLAETEGRDFVVRLLTSRAHGRPEMPPCYHGNPYPSFYLGMLGGPLTAKSWVDLRGFDDLDAVEVSRLIQTGVISEAGMLPNETLTELLECVAGAEDTTRLQERAIRDCLAGMR
ncbi:MAG: hypothetical protein Q8N51_20220 [Gammaproteobacteria bacterium]|nr:hypothetical protein [Gammaproteobacteria bacterium]